MIDWHSHVLPEIDDGSKNVEESISLIDMQASQGVSTIIATPHFYANDESVERFIERRSESFAQIKSALPNGSPEILLGAEVRYYQGISRMNSLKELRIEDSKLLLLEMPMSKWTEYMIRELIELSCMSEIEIVLAHMERYLSLQKPSEWLRLYENGVLMQANASFFTSFVSRHKALSYLKEGYIQFVGSDCHNITLRLPRIGKAFEYIRKKFGDEYISMMNEYGYSMLEHKYKSIF